MGSRKGAFRIAHEENWKESAAGSKHSSQMIEQLLPGVDKPDGNYTVDDYLGHHKWAQKLQPPIHPNLTSYGPTTFCQFLLAERLKTEKLASSISYQQERQLRNYARELVNAQGSICAITSPNGKSFQLSSSLLPSSDDIKTSEKEKSSTRRGKLPATLAQPWGNDSNAVDAVLGGLKSRMEGMKASQSASRRRISRPLRTVDLNQEVDELSRRTLADPQPVPIHDEEEPPQRRVLRSQRRSVPPCASSALLTSTPCASTSSASLVQASDANMMSPSCDTNILISRTSSFEHHAFNSRDSLRTGEGASQFENSLPDTRRRRKTPFASQAVESLAMATPILPHISSILSVSPIGAEAHDNLALGGSGSSSYNPPIIAPGASGHGRLDEQPETSNAAAQDIVCPDDDLAEQIGLLRSLEVEQPDRRPEYIFPVQYDYGNTAPERMPLNVKQAELNRCTIWQAHGFDNHGQAAPQRVSDHHQAFSNRQLDPLSLNYLDAPNANGDYPREVIQSKSVDESNQEFQSVGLLNTAKTHKNHLPIEIWEADTGKSPGGVLHYLSSCEVRDLRLVCRSFAEDLGPYIFRNVVTKFQPSLFNLRPTYSDEGRIDISAGECMLQQYGAGINRFGLTFDYNQFDLAHAPFKVTESVIDAWFGQYVWPIKDYPYFQSLREIDKLLDDDRRLLTQAMGKLSECRELAISVDSGHGWLHGPDMSDFALYRDRSEGGTKIFGRTFNAADRSHENGLKHLFKWAQINTINENIKFLESTVPINTRELERLRSIVIRDYESFRFEKAQPDYNLHLHTGGALNVSQLPEQRPVYIHAFQGMPAALATTLPATLHMRATNGGQRQRRHYARTLRHGIHGGTSRGDLGQVEPGPEETNKVRNLIQPQWPIVFSGYNIARECAGDSSYISRRVAVPSEHLLLPNALTESQAQWLMEMSWIQKSFLSAYTDAVRVNSSVLQNVHSLHISKISSGLLSQLSQRSFWSSLKGLKKITLLVKPDWRFEHTPGDKLFQTSMATNPVNAASKFADILQDCIARLENLNSLHIGYSGGGEHETGVFGRNQHILPAPITRNARAWLIAQNPSNIKPDPNTIIVFPHVRTITFENCWFSPLLLEDFMVRSRDTSLHDVVLKSVSLTVQVTSTRVDGPLRTVAHHLKCQHPPMAWLNEILPPSAAWVQVLDKISPGKTLLDCKFDAGILDEENVVRPETIFRGHVQKIVLESCGYAKILGIPSNELNQNELVYQNAEWKAMDAGLHGHAGCFTKTVVLDETVERPGETESDRRRLNSIRSTVRIRDPNRAPRVSARDTNPKTASYPIMLSGRSSHSRDETQLVNNEPTATTALTGYLTQCIHPIEKRVLERMWGMKFGWGDDVKRWDAVEDGWYIGGTGRFSGTVFRDTQLQEAVPMSDPEETENEVENWARDEVEDDLVDEIEHEEVHPETDTASVTATRSLGNFIELSDDSDVAM